MNKSLERRARRAGLAVQKCRRGTIVIDPVTGKSIYDGNRSTKSMRHERRIESFLRRAEQGGLC